MARPSDDAPLEWAVPTRPRVTRVLVCMTIRSASERVPDTLARVRRCLPNAHVLLVVGGAAGFVDAAVEAVALVDRQVHVLHRRAGDGAAWREAFRWARDQQYGVLVQMDPGGSHRPEDLPMLLDAVGGADLVIGSRWVRGSRLVDWPLWRRLLANAEARAVRAALGVRARDVTSGFRVWSDWALEVLDWQRAPDDARAFDLAMAWQAHEARLLVADVPVTWAYRPQRRRRRRRSRRTLTTTGSTEITTMTVRRTSMFSVMNGTPLRREPSTVTPTAQRKAPMRFQGRNRR